MTKGLNERRPCVLRDQILVKCWLNIGKMREHTITRSSYKVVEIDFMEGQIKEVGKRNVGNHLIV